MENSHLTEVVSLMAGKMVMFTEVANLTEGEWSCYKNGQFNGGIMVITEVLI